MRSAQNSALSMPLVPRRHATVQSACGPSDAMTSRTLRGLAVAARRVRGLPVTLSEATARSFVDIAYTCVSGEMPTAHHSCTVTTPDAQREGIAPLWAAFYVGAAAKACGVVVVRYGVCRGPVVAAV